jgi:hypothetical protein
MTFRLERKEATKALVKFHIKNSAGETVGSVSVPPAQEKDLLASWHGPQARPTAKPADKAAASRAKISASLLKGRPLTPKALLRS